MQEGGEVEVAAAVSRGGVSPSFAAGHLVHEEELAQNLALELVQTSHNLTQADKRQQNMFCYTRTASHRRTSNKVTDGVMNIQTVFRSDLTREKRVSF